MQIQSLIGYKFNKLLVTSDKAIRIYNEYNIIRE